MTRAHTRWGRVLRIWEFSQNCPPPPHSSFEISFPLLLPPNFICLFICTWIPIDHLPHSFLLVFCISSSNPEYCHGARLWYSFTQQYHRTDSWLCFENLQTSFSKMQQVSEKNLLMSNFSQTKPCSCVRRTVASGIYISLSLVSCSFATLNKISPTVCCANFYLFFPFWSSSPFHLQVSLYKPGRWLYVRRTLVSATFPF